MGPPKKKIEEKNVFEEKTVGAGWRCRSNVSLRLPDIGLVVREFANGPGALGSIPGRVIPKAQKLVLDAPLLNTQHYKVRINGKVEQSSERNSVLPYTLV